MRNFRFIISNLAICLVLTIGLATSLQAQATEFSYQGFLNNSNVTANGNFDFEFRLFGALNGGIALATQPKPNVIVINGVFTVALDFGAANFPGADRFIEIAARPVGGGSFTTLAPRQRIGRTPYAINSASATVADFATNAGNAQNATNANTAQNALQLGGTLASQFVRTADPRLTDPRIPLPGSSFYLQNTIAPQASSNFNVSGNGTAGGTLTGNVVSATTHFSIGAVAILKSPGSFNFFAGPSAGFNNTTGTGNSFFGHNAGVFNTTGGSNTFVGFDAGRNNNAGTNNSYFGKDAGRLNNTGNDNSFFGTDAGQTNTTGGSNSFFGKGAGADNTTAAGNSFFGALSGNSNATGANNAFFGFESGRLNDEGSDNSFFGYEAGESNTSGINNSFFGKDAGRLNTTGFQNSFFGFESGESNTTGIKNSFFGYHAGKANTTGHDNAYFGHQAGVSTITGLQNSYFGARAGVQTTDGSSNTMMGTFVGERTTTGNSNSFFGVLAGNTNTTGDENTVIGHRADLGGPNLTNATAIGAFALVTQSDSLILGSIANVNSSLRDTKVGIGTTVPLDRLHVRGMLRVESLGAAGGTSLCHNVNFQISTCSSSLRYKTDISPFVSGLKTVNGLRPITFTWKDGGMHDLGLGAEDVAAIEPLLVTYNKDGEVEGVKYDRIGVVLINAIKEQQAMINSLTASLAKQAEMIGSQKTRLDALTEFVCRNDGTLAICVVEEKRDEK